ncbi:hypothetical protein TIFTF001_041750 [Ficus carica]|uniref:Uncharacterized protein n=1 Tax=Ficus carica TaxID=3494 RepID=A0AA87ZCW7_FICCA|nr:hypothetical protein TIFTF001_041750 [Ficus carica]
MRDFCFVLSCMPIRQGGIDTKRTG